MGRPTAREGLERRGVSPSSRSIQPAGRRNGSLPDRRSDRHDASLPEPVERGAEIETAVLGAGPAGLSAAYALALRGERGTVFEADDVVGGIAKTVELDGYRFDMGGHRFFTKMKPIQRIWEEMLGDELLPRQRLSRIYYRGTFFPYPLKAPSVIGRLGLLESSLCALSYLWSRVRSITEGP